MHSLTDVDKSTCAFVFVFNLSKFFHPDDKYRITVNRNGDGKEKNKHVYVLKMVIYDIYVKLNWYAFFNKTKFKYSKLPYGLLFYFNQYKLLFYSRKQKYDFSFGNIPHVYLSFQSKTLNFYKSKTITKNFFVFIR